MKNLAYILLVVCVCASCQLFEDKHPGAVVQIDDEVLTYDQLDQVTQMATSPEDSAQLAEAFIRQWATEVLLTKEATREPNADIERMVAQYRKDLYLHAYEQKVIAQQLDTEVDEDTIAAYYDQHRTSFTLSNHLIKGLLLIMPNGAPDLKQLRKWMMDPTENIEQIEKYAYQHATGYELFTEDWRTGIQILQHMPLSQQTLTERLRKETQIETSDSLQTYLLQVTDKQMIGEPMPIDFARGEIKKLLLRERQMELIQSHRVAILKEGEERIKRIDGRSENSLPARGTIINVPRL